MGRKVAILVVVVVIAFVAGILVIDYSKDKILNDIDKSENLNVSNNQSNNQVNENTIIKSNSKILIAYFSRAGENYAVGNIDIGNTEVIANYIEKKISNADVFKIEPVTPYPDEYDKCVEIANKEKNEKARPKIAQEIKNIEDYDIIFLGYPIWCEDMPMIMYSFLENYNLDGKTIIPFVTHEGSGNSGTYNKIRQEAIEANVIDGIAIRGQDVNNSEKIIDEWLKELGI